MLCQAFVAGHLTEAEGETLLDALDKRNLLTHTYNEETAEEARTLISERYAPALTSLLAGLQARRARA